MRTLLISPDKQLNRELAAALAAYPEIDLVRQVEAFPEPDEFMRIIRARRPDFVFICVDDFLPFSLLTTTIDDCMPGLPVIGVGREANLLQLVPKLMRLGVRELLTAPITPEKLTETITSVAGQLSKHPAPLARLGDLYAFLPAKPGVGSSTIAISTSCALAHELNVRTLLLDCDLAAGVTRFLLKLGNSSSIVNVLAKAESLDEDLWSQMVGKWDGLDVLHAGELDPPTRLSEASLDEVLSLARAQYDTICADLASSMDPFSVQIMREARRIFMVTTPELVPLHMAADRLRHLNELGLRDKVSLLLNRKSPVRTGLTDGEVAQLVGLPIAHRFWNDYPVVQSAILDGTPVSYRSSLGQSIMDLARSLMPGSESSKAKAHPVEHRKFLEFFHVPAAREHDVWRD
ncbi:MAG: hypothetical protein LAP38_03715 [Acidobacteriia bacterium]|nr:hypothetical protein [Terriglobia bacterium]